ncbi:hypothetical protein EVAR_96648_1 [Eumeta japonica]|uniref:Uncharacterized protein n=1 Tax=Eumeta variegata TaxID=151549 RepID=A0A4C2A008_EUMVA|nr:hypothetical protein EVAR_96648_1 [Eumeta japonica]
MYYRRVGRATGAPRGPPAGAGGRPGAAVHDTAYLCFYPIALVVLGSPLLSGDQRGYAITSPSRRKTVQVRLRITAIAACGGRLADTLRKEINLVLQKKPADNKEQNVAVKQCSPTSCHISQWSVPSVKSSPRAPNHLRWCSLSGDGGGGATRADPVVIFGAPVHHVTIEQ